MLKFGTGHPTYNAKLLLIYDLPSVDICLNVVPGIRGYMIQTLLNLDMDVVYLAFYKYMGISYT